MSISDKEKLRILIPHWIEHNHSHEEEYEKWAESAKENGLGEVADFIEKAIAAMKQADRALNEALDRIGGPAPGGEHHHHH